VAVLHDLASAYDERLAAEGARVTARYRQSTDPAVPCRGSGHPADDPPGAFPVQPTSVSLVRKIPFAGFPDGKADRAGGARCDGKCPRLDRRFRA
jgi:hypothetical protein